MTLTGFCALAALAMARRRPVEAGRAGEAPAGVAELAETQRELFAARNAVNRTGVNLNQAVAALKATRLDAASSGARPGRQPRWADRTGRGVAPSEVLRCRVREVAAIATDEADFFARLAHAGVRVRLRALQP